MLATPFFALKVKFVPIFIPSGKVRSSSSLSHVY